MFLFICLIGWGLWKFFFRRSGVFCRLMFKFCLCFLKIVFKSEFVFLNDELFIVFFVGGKLFFLCKIFVIVFFSCFRFGLFFEDLFMIFDSLVLFCLFGWVFCELIKKFEDGVFLFVLIFFRILIFMIEMRRIC